MEVMVLVLWALEVVTVEIKPYSKLTWEEKSIGLLLGFLLGSSIIILKPTMNLILGFLIAGSALFLVCILNYLGVKNERIHRL